MLSCWSIAWGCERRPLGQNLHGFNYVRGRVVSALRASPRSDSTTLSSDLVPSASQCVPEAGRLTRRTETDSHRAFHGERFSNEMHESNSDPNATSTGVNLTWRPSSSIWPQWSIVQPSRRWKREEALPRIRIRRPQTPNKAASSTARPSSGRQEKRKTGSARAAKVCGARGFRRAHLEVHQV